MNPDAPPQDAVIFPRVRRLALYFLGLGFCFFGLGGVFRSLRATSSKGKGMSLSSFLSRVPVIKASLQKRRLDKLFREVGFVSMLWAELEAALDLSLMMILMIHDDKARSRFPVSLKMKLKLWRRLFSSVGLLAPHKERALDLAGKIAQTKQDRHGLIHGALHWAEELDPMTFHLRRFEFINERPRTQVIPIDQQKIQQTRQVIAGLASELSEFSVSMSRDISGATARPHQEAKNSATNDEGS